MTKPRFTPDPPPVGGTKEEILAWKKRQYDRIHDWWPKDLEKRLAALELAFPYKSGTWPIVDTSISVQSTCVEGIPSCSESADVWNAGALSSSPLVIKNCKFTNPIEDGQVYCMYFTDNEGVGGIQGASCVWHMKYCDIDFKPLNVTTAFFGQFNVPNSSSKRLVGETYNSDKNYINVARVSSRISYEKDQVTSVTPGYGTQAYDGSVPVPTTNVVNVQPGVDTFQDALDAAQDGDNLVLQPGIYLYTPDPATGYSPAKSITKNIRIYGATENPDDVLINCAGPGGGWLTWYMTTIPCIDDGCGNSLSPGMYHLTIRATAAGNPVTWSMIRLSAEG